MGGRSPSDWTPVSWSPALQVDSLPKFEPPGNPKHSPHVPERPSSSPRVTQSPFGRAMIPGLGDPQLLTWLLWDFWESVLQYRLCINAQCPMCGVSGKQCYPCFSSWGQQGVTQHVHPIKRPASRWNSIVDSVRQFFFQSATKSAFLIPQFPLSFLSRFIMLIQFTCVGHLSYTGTVQSAGQGRHPQSLAFGVCILGG